MGKTHANIGHQLVRVGVLISQPFLAENWQEKVDAPMPGNMLISIGD
jgi:hypothetical protein